jgi:tetratricopeptide (TPR) repeat protein
VLDEGYLLDLEASLRREERRFKEALALHDRAFAIAKVEYCGPILLNKAFTLNEQGEYQQSIAVLLSARELIDGTKEPRLLTVLLFNLGSSYLHLGRVAEARPLVREVRVRTERSGEALDFIRGLWLEGQFAAAEGEEAMAITLFSQVRKEFQERQFPYDCALATLDLVLVYLNRGAFREVQRLASEMLTVFEEHGIHREGTAAIALLKEAAEKEQVTASSLQRLQAYLRRAVSRPGLRYAG